MLTRKIDPSYQSAYHHCERFTVFSHSPAKMQSVLNDLARLGFHYDPAAPIALLFDTPVGYGLHTLQAAVERPPNLIVVTQSRCPEYWDDLWDFPIASVLHEDDLEVELESTYRLVSHSKRYRSIPAAPSKLTQMERKVLCLLACGNSNPQIAEQVGVQHKTIRNVLTTIYEKLGVENRTDALLYYWDTWQGCARTAR